jgi:hypothetical protein
MMVSSAHAAWINGYAPGLFLMYIKAAFPSVPKEWLVN